MHSNLRRECLIGLRQFVRRASPPRHSLSTRASFDALKFDSFFSRNGFNGLAAFPGANVTQLGLGGASCKERPSNAIAHATAHPTVPAHPPTGLPITYRRTHSLTLKRLLSVYSELSKARLTILVVLSAMTSVALSPLPTTLPVLLATAAGTTFCAASANTLNQMQEVPFDAQMARTRNRPLVRRAISPVHALGFALGTGAAGPAILWTCVNPTTAILGAANIILYAGAYTYLKRRSVVNTWVGAVVGGIPPLMGWTACGGHLLPSTAYPIHFFLPSFLLPLDLSTLPIEFANNPLAPMALFMILFSWQFPHFNSLSHLVRSSYAQGGYHMLCVKNPNLNALVSLRHALLLIPVCSILVPLSGLTTWAFALTSLVPNLICSKYAWAFWQLGGEQHARKLFFASLWYLPVVMGLMMVHKNGLDWMDWLLGEGGRDTHKAKDMTQ
ncbi:protoheme IX farnesyltransferase [Rickenella mellea]|uniref:Protoheme IX farnesyltransferase, mitochondrial n=1 Tax=Rickenella mellea TaxID=50990 RepID=A0A4Y7QDP8_9AGAM|nr:protoheme IX farnesyltransferase [Rickenella mellea]